jgi:HEAT repeat protein
MKLFPQFLLLSCLLLVSQAPIPAAAQAPDTNIEAVIRQLKDSHTPWEAQSAAVSRLDKMVTSWPGTNLDAFCPAVDCLMPLIGYGGVARRESMLAENILGKLHSVSLPRLLEATKSPEARLRRESAHILGGIRPVDDATVNALANLIADPDADVRRSCYGAFIGFDEPTNRTVPLLLAGTKDSDGINRLIVYTALVNLTHQAEPYVPLIVLSLTNGDTFERSFAAAKLGDCGLLASNACPQLLLALRTGDPQTRVYSAGALPALGAWNPEVVAALITAMAADSEHEVRRTAANSLGGFGSAASNAVPGLIKLLREADAESVAKGPNSSTGWWVAASALGGIATPEAIAGLEEALKNHDPDIQRAAIKALQTIKDRKP